MKKPTRRTSTVKVTARRPHSDYVQIHKRKSNAKARMRILQRDMFRCQNCMEVFIEQQLKVDHIVPLQIGGTDTDDNKQTLCKECHDKKTNSERARHT